MSLTAEIVTDAERQKIKEQADLIAHHKQKACEHFANDELSNWHKAQAIAALDCLRKLALSRVEGGVQ
jgi:hypothetical protein